MLGRNAPPRKADIRGRPPATRIREVIFRALYGLGAPWYDRLTDRLFLGEWERWQRLALRDLPERGTVVELGAGTGVLAAAGATAERRWIAVDASSSMLARAARRRRRGGACLVRAASQALPLADDCCTAIVATFPSNYIMSPATHAELRRIITPGGQLIVVLSGELRPSTPRLWIRWVALRLFYGSARHPQQVLNIEGFVGTVGVIQTEFGSAAVLRATHAPAGLF
ncbi:MAG: class I SAM-dependent methyltransferase [Chloroflexota bacterium]|nr:class I SAM-dependent methyltransferase [Chloroflexota bacterium]